MKNNIIIISGMAGTGKSTFAKWLSAELSVPLVCFDNIIKKSTELAESKYDNPELYPPIVKDFPYAFLWFSIEEIMKSSSPLIVDYVFMEMHRAAIDLLVSKYLYKTIQIHFDANAEIAYKRFIKRNEGDVKEKNIRQFDLDLSRFTELSEDSRNFRYGDSFIYVNTNDFKIVNYNEIASSVITFAKEGLKLYV